MEITVLGPGPGLIRESFDLPQRSVRGEAASGGELRGGSPGLRRLRRQLGYANRRLSVGLESRAFSRRGRVEFSKLLVGRGGRFEVMRWYTVGPPPITVRRPERDD